VKEWQELKVVSNCLELEVRLLHHGAEHNLPKDWELYTLDDKYYSCFTYLDVICQNHFIHIIYEELRKHEH